MTTTKTRRIGPKTQQATDYVRRNPGATMHEVSKHVGPHGSNFYGWLIVKRALAAGLIEHRPEAARRDGQWALFIAEHRHDMNEAAMSDCEYGCKIFRCECGATEVRHMASYGCKA
jgi:hypothetical protein